jgi:hypothetical protein
MSGYTGNIRFKVQCELLATQNLDIEFTICGEGDNLLRSGRTTIKKDTPATYSSKIFCIIVGHQNPPEPKSVTR